jgi:hypothetical protein
VEKKTKCDVFIVDYECECKEGNMMFGGKGRKGLDNKSVMFAHKCNKCGKILEIKNKQYPQMEYKKIESSLCNSCKNNLGNTITNACAIWKQKVSPQKNYDDKGQIIGECSHYIFDEKKVI